MAYYVYMLYNHETMQFYNKHEHYLRNTDLDYNLFSKHNAEKEKFITILYNLVLTMNDVYKRASYYNFDKISRPLLECMNVILDEMDVYVNTNRESTQDEYVIVNSELDMVNNENKNEVIKYFNMLNRDVVSNE